jgi:hypothetical protein
MSQKSIIRTYSSGVHFGEVEEYNPQFGTATLKDSRRLWYWRVMDKKGISLSEVALYGLGSGSKVCSVLPKIQVSEVIEVIPCSDEAIANIEGQEVYKP